MSEEPQDYTVETHGKGYDAENVIKELPSTLSGFTPAPDVLIKKYGFVTALVWGRIWRYCQMSDSVCRAKIETLAAELGMSDRTIIRHIDPLVEDGYLKDMTPDLRNRPHLYADTGKLRIRISIEATMTESQSGVTQSHSAMTLSHPQGDRESHEESIKKQVKKNTTDMLTLTRKILEGSMTIENAIAAGVPVTEDMRKAAEARDQAPKSFEAALGFSKPLPWWSSKEWTTFSVWVVEQYIADARIFEKFEAWRNTPFVKGSISNQRVRGFVTEFYDAFDMFLKTLKKDEPEYVPPVVDSPYAQTADKVFAPMSPELKARHEAVRAKLNANVAKEKRPA